MISQGQALHPAKWALSLCERTLVISALIASAAMFAGHSGMRRVV